MVESWLISATEYITIDQYTTCPEFIYTGGGGGGGGGQILPYLFSWLVRRSSRANNHLFNFVSKKL